MPEERRIVAIGVKPCDGVDPLALYAKIKEATAPSGDEAASASNVKWDEECKVENGKIYASFTIDLAADFDEEVMEVIEMMEDEVASSEVTFQNAMEGEEDEGDEQAAAE